MVEECNDAQANYDSTLFPKVVKLVNEANEGTRFREVRVVFSPLSPFV